MGQTVILTRTVIQTRKILPYGILLYITDTGPLKGSIKKELINTLADIRISCE